MTDVATQAPPHPFIVPVSPRDLEGRTCLVCGARYDGGVQVEGGGLIGERKFVELRIQLNGGDPVVPPGTLLTEREQGGRRHTTFRDPWSGQAVSLAVEVHPVLCSDCLTAGGHAAGMPPATDAVLIAEREQRERADTAERQRDELAAELDQLKGDLHVVHALERLFAAEHEAGDTDDEPKPRKTTRRRTNAD